MLSTADRTATGDTRRHPRASATAGTGGARGPSRLWSARCAPRIGVQPGDNLPAQYRSGVFIGEHGSWDRDPPVGYKVVYIPLSDGRPKGPPQDVVTGFISNDGKTRGRPVGVAIDRTGGILIADDVGNTKWRVTATSSTTTPAASP
jgi:glucose/arabinose dehydrogenase